MIYVNQTRSLTAPGISKKETPTEVVVAENATEENKPKKKKPKKKEA